MKTKNSRRLRNLMLLTSLCAILSCSSGGGGSGGKSYIENNTPINPPIVNPTPGTPPVTPGSSVTPPVVVNNTRYTTTPDITKLKERLYDRINYTQDNDNNVYNGNTTIIGDRKYGFKLDKDDPISIKPSTVMNVKKDGAAFDITFLYTPSVTEIRNILNDKIKNAHNLKLNMDPDSNFLLVEFATIKLSDPDFSNIIPNALKDRITGTEYNEVKFINSKLEIDEDINLDDDNNKYYKKLSNIKPLKVTLNSGNKITGTKDGQVGIKANDEVVNDRDRIKLTGKNSVALFSKRDIYNRGFIEVGEDSIAQYTFYDTADAPHSSRVNNNSENITLGKTSTGIRMDREYKNIGGKAYNGYNGKISSTAEKVTGMMAYTANKQHPTGDTNDFEIGNYGEINLSGDKSTGMYVAGNGSTKMYNKGKIIMGNSSDRSNPSIGMFSTNSRTKGFNDDHGIIEVGENSIGMAGINGGKLYNDGIIIIKGAGGIGMVGVNIERMGNAGEIIIKANGSIGMYIADGTEGINTGTIETDGTGLKDVIGVIVGKDSVFINDELGRIYIKSENGKGVVFEKGAVVKNKGVIGVNGKKTDPEEVATRPITIKTLSDRIAPVKSDLGIYMNSLGKTNPIEGLANLGLNSADLLIGAEATEKTNATEVTVGQDVLKPFNDSIHTSNIADWTVKSGSLIWEADPEIKDNRIEKVTLKKQSYAKFADENTEGVAKALDEKYVVANEKDKQIFNYMNTLRSAESLGGVYREIRGSQYINVQQRINQTDNLLDKQISSLQKDNADKAGHHIETFFNKDKHSFKTDEVPDTTSTAYGVSYLFNNTDNNWGLYGGIAINRYKFKDIAHSKENITMFKAGGYKKFDLNNFDWTLSGDVFISQNDMKRRVMVGNNIYEHKADYNAYGFSVKNEISKTYQLTEDSTIKPYGALKLGYGSFNRIKEKDGTLRMDVKGNSYYSVKPSAGVEVAYTKKITDNTKFKASLDLAYEHELGNANRKENEIKFIDTNTTYKLKGAKSENRGNFRSGVKVGMETGRFNFSVNGGYDTQDKNAHIGVGFGASF